MELARVLHILSTVEPRVSLISFPLHFWTSFHLVDCASSSNISVTDCGHDQSTSLDTDSCLVQPTLLPIEPWQSQVLPLTPLFHL